MLVATTEQLCTFDDRARSAGVSPTLPDRLLHALDSRGLHLVTDASVPSAEGWITARVLVKVEGSGEPRETQVSMRIADHEALLAYGDALNL